MRAAKGVLVKDQIPIVTILLTKQVRMHYPPDLISTPQLFHFSLVWDLVDIACVYCLCFKLMSAREVVLDGRSVS